MNEYCLLWRLIKRHPVCLVMSFNLEKTEQFCQLKISCCIINWLEVARALNVCLKLFINLYFLFFLFSAVRFGQSLNQ